MKVKVLLVDDELNVLQGFYRNLRSRFPLEVALGADQAILAMEEHGPFGVVVSDMRMPGRSGVELLEEIKERWPECMRIMLTGDVGQDTAAEAVNRGMVFRFLRKPCSSEDLAMAIESGMRQYHLERAERELLDETLSGTLKTLCEILGIVDPDSFGQAQYVRELAEGVGRRLGCPEPWELSVAAMLTPIGRVILPPGLWKKARSGELLNQQEQLLLDQVPAVGARLLENIPRMGNVSDLIRLQSPRPSLDEFPPSVVAPEEVPLGVKILLVLNAFVEVFAVRRNRAVALEAIKLKARGFDPRVIGALEAELGLDADERREISEPCRIPNLREGMILGKDLCTTNGHVVFPAGIRIGQPHLQLIRDASSLLELVEPIYILGV